MGITICQPRVLGGILSGRGGLVDYAIAVVGGLPGWGGSRVGNRVISKGGGVL